MLISDERENGIEPYSAMGNISQIKGENQEQSTTSAVYMFRPLRRRKH